MGGINWFPGHMHSARKDFVQIISKVDIVLELVDARAPRASSNPLTKEICSKYQKLVLKVINKVDLADSQVTKSWVNYFKLNNFGKTILLSAKKQNINGKIIANCRELIGKNLSPDYHIKILIAGIPNVGKSTIFNSLANRKVAKVADLPAVTRKQRTLGLNGEKIKIIDTPGLLWPKIHDERTGKILAANNNIGQNAFQEVDVAQFLVEFLTVHYPENLNKRYGVEELNNDGASLLTEIAPKKKLIERGNVPNIRRAANILLRDYRAGYLGRISLENPVKYRD